VPPLVSTSRTPRLLRVVSPALWRTFVSDPSSAMSSVGTSRQERRYWSSLKAVFGGARSSCAEKSPRRRISGTSGADSQDAAPNFGIPHRERICSVLGNFGESLSSARGERFQLRAFSSGVRHFQSVFAHQLEGELDDLESYLYCVFLSAVIGILF